MEQGDQNQDEQLENYRSSLKELQSCLDNLMLKFSKEEDFKSGLNSLSANYEIMSSTLSTLLNWIRLHQSVLAAFGSIYDLARLLSSEKEDTDVSIIRYQLRVMISNQVETLTQNLLSSERSAKNVLQFATGQLDNIPRIISETADFDQGFLSSLQYNAIYDSTLLSEAINSLYRGEFNKFKEIIDKINSNLEQD
ncbi:MAG: hypothetical protein ACTSP4_02260 [Candidatus Hodarchaeales archaeon]